MVAGNLLKGKKLLHFPRKNCCVKRLKGRK
jgi:hypothetical protein